ncbi:MULTISPECIES: alpha/beta hydrolase [unclassified Janthinobacterium]|uniref:alpha/beta hydrolase n=1 Tax=unclassified Janthinobacterium TaxID=2610881 RepID=UPI000C111D51|nr:MULTISPECIES: alpha/beta hydrolase [unclassified Janthinobacterium]MDZ5634739.1 alpha/beta hydrolase [Janthinobacterium sp. GMG1]PHV27174.1 alpha/beta hydrolase [Janthinobacterium sp. BJB426]
MSFADTAAELAPGQALKIRDIEVQGAQDALAARVYTAGVPGARQSSLIVFFHGGGFVDGDLDDADDFLRCLVLSNPDHVVLAANYTLAKVRPFPAAVEDAHAVLLWAKKNKSKLGWTGKQMVVSGIEAGANLAAVCAMMSRDRGGPPLAGQVLIMPMLDPGLSTCSMRHLPSCPDLAEVADQCAAAYRGYLPNAADRTHPYASPLQSSRLKNLPPALILSSEDDPLRDEAEQYGSKLIACGIKTTVRRMAAAPLQDATARNECACKVQVLSEIASFVAGLGQEPES